MAEWHYDLQYPKYQCAPGTKLNIPVGRKVIVGPFYNPRGDRHEYSKGTVVGHRSTPLGYAVCYTEICSFHNLTPGQIVEHSSGMVMVDE